ncbi:MAG: CinA family protein [Dissulfurispiraceae bacterium]|jgi:nicotinamide-nucleotide amidase|nr:CinA family protein [Dissulfurispiraceae bacterium]
MTEDENQIKVVELLHALLKERGIRLAAAESCTGGFISHLVTMLPGASAVFSGSVICYNNEAKISLLGIDHSTIDQYGAISSETAIEMAEQARLLFDVDCALSTTGNLGPDAQEDKQVGLVYIGVSYKGHTDSVAVVFEGDRMENRHQAALEAIELLCSFIKSK